MRTQSERKSAFNLTYLAIIILILIILLFIIINRSVDELMPVERTVDLWNGTDFNGWEFFLDDSLANPDTVFEVKDDVIRIGGQPFGYMRTTEKYDEYDLHVEWRWPEEPGNSGVFLNIAGEDMKWPMTIECQLMSGNAGDLVFLGGSDAAERMDKSNMVLPKYEESSENPPGAWNTYSIRVKNDSIIVNVNGTLQNICSMPFPKMGYIGLQSEGAPIEFRNVYLINTSEN